MFDTAFKLMLRRLGLLLVLYTLLRLLFYIFNPAEFAGADAGKLLFAFAHGLRFDVAAILITNAVFILLSLFPVGNTLHPTYQRVLKWVFILCNAPFIALAIVDVEFFKFIGRRTSNELFSITGDITSQLIQLMGYYWYLTLGFVLLVLGLARAFPKAPALPSPAPNVWLRGLRLVLVAGFVVLGIRGGLQLKPLRPSHAFIVEPAALGHLTLNSPFTFIKGIGQTSLEQKNYFETEQKLLQALQFDPQNYNQAQGTAEKQNVVIIILESFAAEYVGALNNGQGYTPFLDSLATQGVLFRDAFANGRKSIESLPSILAGMPSLMPEPFITSPYQANEIYGLGTILQQEGYHTAMFHGAANGSMGFNNFAIRAGMQEYYGLDEYPSSLRKQDFDGQWGIFDEPYLQYVSRELTGFQQPFMATLFTLSSHQPYTIPDKYKGRFPKGELEIHESIGYADHALRQFFKSAARQPWYANTLFILTADHTQKSINPAYQNELGNFRVPLLLFHSNKSLESIDAGRVAQHADIPATVVDFLQVKTDKLLPFSKSLLDTASTGNAILYNGSSYLLVQPEVVTMLSQDDALQFYTFPDLAPASPALQSGQLLKAQVQYFRNGLVNNRLYFWKEEI
ncbi:phosphoglycerol transferase MdoB-like AlkP superfamily enzyme [Pontibacter mucosus]|uniref:Phosphoglycerol transferase MdoB-like AlkP superfamily enzyme n=1 Tax=Pontibacter mucosus TaxID=1649266 RepID=A0A2T5YCQ7_9BACT|nr:LTA synthase family protein [Pontibacter mucosus]PTX14241.1 phosphoglycerol transferase MdoB-like AlkP superfamily enzyme [Pontibacter mucosus]